MWVEYNFLQNRKFTLQRQPLSERVAFADITISIWTDYPWLPENQAQVQWPAQSIF